MRHYHVHAGLHGCLPDESHVARTLQEALQVAQEMRRTTEEVLGTRLWGSLRRDRLVSDGMNYVEILPCSDPTCLEEED